FSTSAIDGVIQKFGKKAIATREEFEQFEQALKENKIDIDDALQKSPHKDDIVQGGASTIAKEADLRDATYELQRDVIKKSKDEIASNKDSNIKGAFAEICNDVFLTEKGFKALHKRLTSVEENWGSKGIDAIFKKDEIYYIVEVKYHGTARLSTLSNGIKQMSDDWILGDNRVLKAVGGKTALADEIKNSNYTRLLAETDSNGTVTYQILDKDAKVIGPFIP
ncbi:MAG: hypothetical protein LBP56_00755, partial [Odoribacteraceae bacterium]|nr:hypothetical protein [Odoribacteraceae bacterium]